MNNSTPTYKNHRFPIKIVARTSNNVTTPNGQFAMELRYFASLSMIHSTFGSGTKRHLRSGPAMTLR